MANSRLFGCSGALLKHTCFHLSCAERNDVMKYYDMICDIYDMLWSFELFSSLLYILCFCAVVSDWLQRPSIGWLSY